MVPQAPHAPASRTAADPHRRVAMALGLALACALAATWWFVPGAGNRLLVAALATLVVAGLDRATRVRGVRSAS